SDLTEAALQTLAPSENGAGQMDRALRFLESAPAAQAAAPILDLLDRFPPASTQIVAIQTLSRLNSPGLAEVLVGRWKTVSPEARREILSTLLMKQPQALVAAVESGRILPGEVDASSRSVLLRHADVAIRQRAAALWVQEKSHEVIQKYRAALD